MGRVNIYIKKEDEAAWESIEDKPGFIHNSIINYGLAEANAPGSVQEAADKYLESAVPPPEPSERRFPNDTSATDKDYKFPPSAASML